MSVRCFLLDENVPLVIQTQLEQRGFSETIYAIGDGTAPPKGTPDPEILVWVEDNGCLLITNNRASIPVHLQDHLAQNYHISGIIQLPKRMNVGRIVEDLVLIGEVSYPDEFQDQIVYLPLA